MSAIKDSKIMPDSQPIRPEHDQSDAMEPSAEGSNPTTFFHGKRERSKTEALVKLLFPEEWKRVERLKNMRRERLLREKEEAQANEPEAVAPGEQVEGAENSGEPEQVPGEA